MAPRTQWSRRGAGRGARGAAASGCGAAARRGALAVSAAAGLCSPLGRAGRPRDAFCRHFHASLPSAFSARAQARQRLDGRLFCFP